MIPSSLLVFLRRFATAACVPLVLSMAACTTLDPAIDPAFDQNDDVSDIVAAAAAAAETPARHESAQVGDAPAPVSSPPIDPLRPEVAVNLDDATASTDLWARLRRGFGMPDLITPLVQNREQWYASRPDYVQRMTVRGSRYLFHIIEEVERRGMPTELALLPFIESAFNPQALSSAKASGMWQFMPATGRFFDLRQNVFRDDRRDVLSSTRAALDYLGKLYGMFGDWHLALAAYNWGEGSVQRAIARNRKAGLPTDYLSLRMPEETRYYVPKFQAVKNIMARPETYGLRLPPVENHPYFLSVPIERDIDVALAIELSGVKREEFMTLNPQMNKPVILAAGTPRVLLPYDNASQFITRLRNHHGPLATWTAWVAPHTMRPSEAAHQVGMPEDQLREVNAIPGSMRIVAGSTLLVPRSQSRHEDVSLHLADNAVMSLSPEVSALRRVTVRAGRKDSVSSVARRYRLSPDQIAQWNNTSAGASFKPGQTVVVFLARKSTRSRRQGAITKPGRSSTKVASHRTKPKAVLAKRERPRSKGTKATTSSGVSRQSDR